MNDSLSIFVLIYFIYGLAFYTLGIGAILQANNRYKANTLVEAIPYLGMFGLLHGILEWLIMLSYTTLFANNYNSIRIIIGILGTVSFAFLWLFAVKLIFARGSQKKYKFVQLVTIIYTVIVYILGLSVWQLSFSVRFLMGAPSAIFAGISIIVLTKDKFYRNLKDMNKRLYVMATLLMVYGLTQILTQNIIGKLFGLRIELARAALAVLMTISFISIIKILKQENEKRMSYLITRKGIEEEQKRISREMHDVVLQDLFSIGLELEQLEDHSCVDEKEFSVISKLKVRLNSVMGKIRAFIATSMFEKNDISDLHVKLQSMVMSFKDNYTSEIVLNNPQKEIEYGFLELESVSHIFYIVKESVINALKHSGCSVITISLKSTIKGLRITVTDNGCGFKYSEIQSDQGIGLTSMLERANIISGEINFKSSGVGTKIELYFPWEG